MNFDPSCIDVDDFMECLDVQNVQQATMDEIRFSCPFPAHAMGDETPSAYMNVETTAFFCHACHEKGNAIHFTCKLLGISPIEAIRLLKGRYSPQGIDPDSRNMREEVRKILDKKEDEVPRLTKLDESVLGRFLVNWDKVADSYGTKECPPEFAYMLDRGFDSDTLLEWQFGYDDLSNRIVLPVRDEDGDLVGFKARAWDDRKPKYLNLGGDRYGFAPFLKNSVVFGLDRAKHFGKHLIVVEGELNVIAMCDKGYPNTVAINGSYFGPRQIHLLRRYAESVTLFFDSDPAGYDATKAVKESLKDFMSVYIAPDHDGDPADMDHEEIRACVEQAISHVKLQLLRS